MAIDAKTIKALRESTGMGMSDCKKALVEADGSIEEAEMILRKRGIDKAAKKADRATGEGVIKIIERDGTVLVVQVECEQEPTTGNERFLALVDDIIETAFASKAASAEELMTAKSGDETIAEKLTALIGVIGENVVIKRIERLEKPANGVIGMYTHFNNKSGAVCVIDLEGGSVSEELQIVANDVCMHSVATRPVAVDRDGVPADLVNKEKEVFMEEVKNKPENIQDKILEGKLGKFYGEKCLLEQIFVKDPDGKLTITNVIDNAAKNAGGTAKLSSFARMELGN